MRSSPLQPNMDSTARWAWVRARARVRVRDRVRVRVRVRDRVRVRVRFGVNPKANLGHAARQAGVRGARGGEGHGVVGGGEQREGCLVIGRQREV